MSVGTWVPNLNSKAMKYYEINDVQHVAIWPGTSGQYFAQICGNIYEKIYRFENEEKAKVGILKIWLEKKVCR